MFLYVYNPPRTHHFHHQNGEYFITPKDSPSHVYFYSTHLGTDLFSVSLPFPLPERSTSGKSCCEFCVGNLMPCLSRGITIEILQCHSGFKNHSSMQYGWRFTSDLQNVAIPLLSDLALVSCTLCSYPFISVKTGEIMSSTRVFNSGLVLLGSRNYHLSCAPGLDGRIN